MPNFRLTDIQEIQNYIKLVYKHPGYVSKRFQKDISCGTKDIKQFSQLITDTQTDTQTDTRTSVNLELTPPEVGQLIIYNGYIFNIIYKQLKPSLISRNARGCRSKHDGDNTIHL